VKKPVAFGLTVFLVNVCGTLSFLTLGLTLTTRIAGVSSTSSSGGGSSSQ